MVCLLYLSSSAMSTVRRTGVGNLWGGDVKRKKKGPPKPQTQSSLGIAAAMRFFLSYYSSEDVLTHLRILVRIRWVAIAALSVLLLTGKQLGVDVALLRISASILVIVALVNALSSLVYDHAQHDSTFLPWAMTLGFVQALTDLIGILLGIHYLPVGHIRLSVLFLVLYFGGMAVVFPLPQSLPLILLGILAYSGMVWAYTNRILPAWDPSGKVIIPSRQELLLETLSAITLGVINGVLLYAINGRLQRIRKEAESHQERMTQLQHLTQNGLRSQSLEDLIRLITHELCDLLGAQGCTFYLRMENTTHLVSAKAMHNFQRADIEVLLRSIEETPQEERPSTALFREFRNGSVLAIRSNLESVHRGYRAWILLWFSDEKTPRNIDPSLFQQIQTTITLLLSQALAREELHQKVHILASLAQTAHRLSQTLDLNTLFRLIVEDGCALVNASRGVLCLITPFEGKKRFICPYARGIPHLYLDYVEKNYTQMPGFHLLARKEDAVIHIPDVSKSGIPALQEAAKKLGFQAITYLRISAPEQLLGALVLYWEKPYILQPYEYDALYLFAAQAGTILHNAQMYAFLQAEAQTDPLTGLYNRRALFRLLESEIQRCRRHQRPLSLLLIDLDDFKRVNDRFGHNIGDIVLRQVAHHLRQALGDTSILTRYGGDEFVVVLPETSPEEAWRIAQNIHQRFQNFIPDIPEPLNPPITLSIGVATYPQDGTDPHTLIEVADRRMYKAKGNHEE